MTVIEQNLRQLNLLKMILHRVQTEHYLQIKNWPGKPSVGRHVRHILDHYEQLKIALKSKHLDYRNRSRDISSEINISHAIKWIENLDIWLQGLGISELDMQLTYQFAEGKTYSSLKRELDFIASHTVHHLALIHVMLEPFDYEWPEEVGVHSSTQEHYKRCAP